MIVAVIGCGPAGLAAAHAATGLGADVLIYAPKNKTPQAGPLLIQRPIPGINMTHPDGTIHQLVIGGSILEYRYKLYGDINIQINGDILNPSYHAWDHRRTYNLLWELYADRIADGLVTPERLSYMAETYDLVVSTANAKKLCFSNHDFPSKTVAVSGEYSYPDQPDNTIIFNAGDEFRWVRSSRVFGVPMTEWLTEDAPYEARVITKPISTNCDCYPKVLRTGRFGKWKNETWVDTAYWDTYTAIESMMRSGEIAAIR